MQDEQSATGGVSWAVVKAYITALGGWPVVVLLFTVFILAELFRVGATVWLSIWTGEMGTVPLGVLERRRHWSSELFGQCKSACLQCRKLRQAHSTLKAEQAALTPKAMVSCACLLACTGQEPQEAGQPEQHSSLYYMGIYAAISGAQLVMLQINFTCVVTFGIRAGRWVVQVLKDTSKTQG